MNTKRILLGITVVFLFVMFPTKAFAGLEGGLKSQHIGIAPYLRETDDLIRTIFGYEAAPGAVIEDAVTIANLADIPVSVVIDTVDNDPKAKEFTLKNNSDSKEVVGKWVVFEGEKNYTLRPKEERVVPFKIKIPDNIPTGEYSGGIILDETDASAMIRTPSKSNVAVLIKTRLGLRVRLRVKPGIPTKSILMNTVPRFHRDVSIQERFSELPLWEKLGILGASIYLLIFFVWTAFDFIKKHKIFRHPKIHRIILPIRWLSLLAVVFTFSSWFVVHAAAATLTLIPPETNPSMTFRGSPGDVLEGTITVRNLGLKKANVDLSLADAFLTSSGVMVPAAPHEDRHIIDRWLEMENKISLKASESKKMAFRIKIPEDITPGDYIGYFVAQGFDYNHQSGVGIDVASRMAVPLHIVVRGERVTAFSASQLEIQKEADNSLKASLYIQNKGNVISQYTLKFNLIDSKGIPIDTFIQGTNPIPPKQGTTFVSVLPWNISKLKWGSYIVMTEVGQGEKLITLRGYFNVKMPTVYRIGITAGIILVLIFLFWGISRLFRKKSTPQF